MTNQLITLKFYSDPAHGWLAVKRELLYDLGIAAKVSFYSYEKGKTVYLEEDCDAGVWLRAHGERADRFPVNFLDVDAPCRSLPRVQAVAS